MKLPLLTELDTNRDMIDVFKGYNHNLRIGENEFYDMENLTSSYYPVLSPRERRGVYDLIHRPQALIEKGSLCYVDGSDFIVNNYKVAMGLSTDPKDYPKHLVSMGAYVIILPDKKYINIADITDFGNIEADVTTQSTVSFDLCKVDGTSYDTYQNTEPEITEAMKKGDEKIPLWLDTSTTPHALKQYSISSAMWSTIPTTYVKISVAGDKKVFEPFEVGDGVTISGIEIEQLSDLNNTMIIWAKGDDYIVVTGIIDFITTQDNPINVKRQMPNMDFIIESENRLWGCRYGVALNGEVVNEIYASKLGDFKNWNCYMGISTDSYAATVGTDGQFTGAITYAGSPLFFKENYMHKVYGNYPANYQITATACRGVQKGSHKSLAIVNERLYYKSNTGVCVYDGSLPQEISYPLGNVPYINAVAGSHGNKYYISMFDNTDYSVRWINPLLSGSLLYIQQAFCTTKNETTLNIDVWERPVVTDSVLTITQTYTAKTIQNKLYVDKENDIYANKWNLFVYDTEKGLWHKEDHTHVDDFCSCKGELFYIDHADQCVKTMFGTGTVDSHKVKWMAETGVIGVDQPDKKYISKINLRMSLALNSRVSVWIKYDADEVWNFLFRMDGTSLKSFTVPIRPKRCDHLKLRIEGEGEAKIYSISKTIEQGSDY